MLKKLFCLTLFCNTLFATGVNQKWLDIKPASGFKIGNHFFRFFVWNNNWKTSILSDKTAYPDASYPSFNGSGFKYRGTLTLSKSQFKLNELLDVVDEDNARFVMSLTSSNAIKINDMSASTIISKKKWNKSPFLFDGKRITVPAGRKDVVIGKINSLTIPVKSGVIILKGKCYAWIKDISTSSYAPDSLQIRLRPIPYSGMIKKTGFDFVVTYRPDKSIPLDLRRGMNMAFKDDLPNDGKGGWTDQGGFNDLSAMVPGKKILVGIDFSIVDPETNGGKSCIVLRGERRQDFPAGVEVGLKRVEGKYLYLLHASAWDAPKGSEVGKVICEYQSGEKETFPVVSKVNVANFWKPGPLKSAVVGWRGDNDVASIGLYVTCFEMKRRKLKKISFKSSGTSVWMIVAASVANKKFDLKAREPVVLKANADWYPFAGKRKVVKGSVLDFSGMHDAPAGKYGFARNSNGHIVFEKRPDIPVRFYGTNLCFSVNYMEKDQTDRLINELDSIGYNIIRLHHFDRDTCDRSNGKSTKMAPGPLDKMDYLISEAKKHGIYITLDLYISRPLSKGELPGFPGKRAPNFKGLVFVSDAAMRNWQEYAANLMNHVNPYTGIAWKNEPAIVSISLVNEDAISKRSEDKSTLPLFEEKFKDYLKRRNYKITYRERGRYWKKFLQELYSAGYAQMHDFLRSIGVKQMLTDQNHDTSIITMLLREQYDLVDNHFYWSHPAFLQGNWKLPALVENTSSISRGAGGLSSMFQARRFGVPFSISEWEYANPNKYNTEGPFLVGAYAALQDWSILCRFAYSQNARQFKKSQGTLYYFDAVNDPLRLVSERVGLIFFLRGDIRSSDVSIPLLLDRRHFDSPGATNNCGIVPERIGLVAKTGNIIYSPGEKINLPNETKAVIADQKNAPDLKVPMVDFQDHVHIFQKLKKSGALPEDCGGIQSGKFRSTTKQLELNTKDDSFKAISAKSEGFLMEPDKVMQGNFASVENKLCFAGVLIASVDSRSLKDSTRMLLLHITDTKCTGMKFSGQDMRIVESWGKLPLLIRKGEAKVTLNRGMNGYKLYAVDFDGRRRFEVPMNIIDKKTKFTLKTVNPGGIIAAYELVKEHY